jgi:hypothetical protein
MKAAIKTVLKRSFSWCTGTPTTNNSTKYENANEKTLPQPLNSKDDAYVFRIKPWTSDDLATILSNNSTLMSLMDRQETPATVTNAILRTSCIVQWFLVVILGWILLSVSQDKQQEQ